MGANGYDIPVEATTTDEQRYILNFGIFFDGTSNNKWDTDAKKVAKGQLSLGSAEKDAKAAKAYHQYTDKAPEISKGDLSYESEYSNVARLYQSTHDIDNYAIYIKGAGTNTDEDEQKNIHYGGNESGGTGFGQGNTGIRQHVRNACEKVAKKISEFVDQKKKDKSTVKVSIILDVFGFSRGATTARNFAYEVLTNMGIRSTMQEKEDYTGTAVVFENTPDTQGYVPSNDQVPPLGYLGYHLKEQGINLCTNKNISVRIRFMGIYDTVSTYEPEGGMGAVGSGVSHNFENDITELELNNFKADYLVHLTSLDEHRNFFALTHIDKSCSPNTIEIPMPGVHSDIGGSYEANATEERILLNMKDIETDYAKKIRQLNAQNPSAGYLQKYYTDSMQNDKRHLIDEGWFVENELKMITDTGILSDTYMLTSTRSKLSNQYSYIPLHLMYKFLSGEWQDAEKARKWKTCWINPDTGKSEDKIIIDKDKLDKYSLTNYKNLRTSIEDRLFYQGKDEQNKDIVCFQGNRLHLRITSEIRSGYLDYFCQVESYGRWYNVKYACSTWQGAMVYLLEYLFQFSHVVLSNEMSAMTFAMYYFLPEDTLEILPDRIKKYPEFKSVKKILEDYGEAHHLLSDLEAFNKVISRQIYLRKLRNRFLHWSSNFKHNVLDNQTLVNILPQPRGAYYPRLVGNEDIKRERQEFPQKSNAIIWKVQE